MSNNDNTNYFGYTANTSSNGNSADLDETMISMNPDYDDGDSANYNPVFADTGCNNFANQVHLNNVW